MTASPHIDTWARRRASPPGQWPVLRFDRPEFQYPEQLNAATVLLDDALAEGHGARTALLQGDRRLSYADLAALTDAIGGWLARERGVRPGDRVLLRGANTPELFAAWLAVVKIGAIVVPTMPLLRRRELATVLRRARPVVALCEPGLEAELAEALADTAADVPCLIAPLQAPDGTPAPLAAAPTRADDICLIAFTSGTTGEPKACLHFHRDVLAMCDGFARHSLAPTPDAVFTGTPPIAFTFGLGALLAFPLRFRAAAALPVGSGPDALAQTIARHRASHVFTSPTGYRAMLAQTPAPDLSSLTASVSAGEHLNAATWQAWHAATGLRMIEGIGSTEMIHIFLSSTAADARPGSVGRPVPGYEAALLAPDGALLEGEATGRLAVRGPTGCRYMSDPRQANYVVNGWNVTGDVFARDAEGYYRYVARSDDMIVSSGYNISGPEIEAVLMEHPHVHECAVLGMPDAERGQIVRAVIVPAPGVAGDDVLAEALKAHVKARLSPYKYPRRVDFRDSLPRTANGKLQRHLLAEPAPHG